MRLALTVDSTSLLLLLLGYSEEGLCQIYGDRWLLCNKIPLKTIVQLQTLECETNCTSYMRITSKAVLE